VGVTSCVLEHWWHEEGRVGQRARLHAVCAWSCCLHVCALGPVGACVVSHSSLPPHMHKPQSSPPTYKLMHKHVCTHLGQGIWSRAEQPLCLIRGLSLRRCHEACGQRHGLHMCVCVCVFCVCVCAL